MPDDGTVYGLIGAIAGPLSVALLRLAAPALPSDIKTTRSLEDLHVEYRGAYAREGSITMLVGAILTGLAYLGLTHMKAWVTPLGGPTEWVFAPGRLYWAAPASMLGFAAAVVVAAISIKRVLGDRHDEYQQYIKLKYAADVRRFNPLVVKGMLTLAAVLAAAGMNALVIVSTNGILIRRGYELRQKLQPFSAVAKIESVQYFKALSGDLNLRPRFITTFRDGTDWSTEDVMPDSDLPKNAAAVNYVSTRSGVPIAARDWSERE